MAVDVEGDCYGGVAQHLLNHLGVGILGSQQGHAGVSKVVEAGGVGEPRLFENRLGGGEWGRYRDEFEASGKRYLVLFAL